MRLFHAHLVGIHHLGDAVGLNQCVEEGEALPDVEQTLVAVDVDARHFNVVSRPRDVDVVPEQDDFLAAGDTSRQHFAGRFLQIEFLEVAVDGLLLVDWEGPSRLAGSAVPQSDVVDCVDVERPLQEAALYAFVDDLLQLAEHLTPDRDYALD